MRCVSPCAEKKFVSLVLKIFPDGASTYPRHHELGDDPVRVVAVVQQRHLDVPVVDGHGIVGPVVVALFATLLERPRQHDDRPGVAFPAHAPEVVPRRVQRTLRHDELAWRIVSL